MSNPPDFVGLSITVMAYWAGNEIAEVAGPYAAITVLASAGSALSLSNMEPPISSTKATLFIFTRIALAVVLTVSLAEFFQMIAPWMQARYTLIPVAFAIGWIADYSKVKKWLSSVIVRFVDRKTDNVE